MENSILGGLFTVVQVCLRYRRTAYPAGFPDPEGNRLSEAGQILLFFRKVRLQGFDLCRLSFELSALLFDLRRLSLELSALLFDLCCLGH